MASYKIIKSYSQALFELAQEKGAVDIFNENIVSLESIFKRQSEVIDFFNRNHDRADNDIFVKMIDDINSKYQLLPEVRNVLLLIAENNRLDALMEILSDFQLSVKKLKNIHLVEITSVNELTIQEKSEIISTLKEKMGGDIELTCLVDATIIGGIVIKVGDHIYDNSMLAKLNSIRNSLSKGAHGL